MRLIIGPKALSKPGCFFTRSSCYKHILFSQEIGGLEEKYLLTPKTRPIFPAMLAHSHVQVFNLSVIWPIILESGL